MTMNINAAKSQRLANDVMAFAIQDAEAGMRPVMRWLYGLFAQYNTAYFGGRLPVPYILVGDVHDGYARYSEVGSAGWAHQITVKRTVIEGTHKHMLHGSHDPNGRKLFQADVLLHACLDMYMVAVLQTPDLNEKGHGAAFADEANRIGKALGLPDVGPSRSILRNGSNRNMSRFTGTQPCGEWPWIVRPAGYYRGVLALPKRAPKGKAARLMAGLPAVAPAPAATPAEVKRLLAEIARLKGDLTLVEADLATARAGTGSGNGTGPSDVPDTATTAAVVKALKDHAALLKPLCQDEATEAKRLAGLVNDLTRPILGEEGRAARSTLALAAAPARVAASNTGLSAMWAWDRVSRELYARYGTAGRFTDWACEVWQAALE